MALSAYLLATRSLLQAPPAPEALYPDVDLIRYINTARGQIAGEGQCIRLYTTLPVIQGGRQYAFSSIAPLNPAIAGVINVRTVWRTISSGTLTSTVVVTWRTATGAVMNWTTASGAPMVWTIQQTVPTFSGQVWMTPRSFEWFSIYELNSVTAVEGPPQRWSQFGQGAGGNPAQGGSLWVAPVPDDAYLLSMDTVCFPVDLIDDTTPEAVPYLWTDAIPYYAAFLAYMSAQSPARQADAQRMLALYSEFVSRARRFSTPDVLPGIYPQQSDPFAANRLGLQKAG